MPEMKLAKSLACLRFFLSKSIAGKANYGKENNHFALYCDEGSRHLKVKSNRVVSSVLALEKILNLGDISNKAQS